MRVRTYAGHCVLPACCPCRLLLTRTSLCVSGGSVVHFDRFQAFVEAGGYQTREWWTHEGWRWLTRGTAAMNVGHHETTDANTLATRMGARYWKCIPPEDGDGKGKWKQRFFDREVELAPNEPVVHVSWYEATAYCNWAGRRCVMLSCMWLVAVETQLLPPLTL